MTMNWPGLKSTDLLVKRKNVEQDYVFGDLLQINRATLQYRKFNGQWSEPVTRINIERGDSVGVLLYDTEEDLVFLVRQFRYPVYASLGLDQNAGDEAQPAWLLEIVAGIVGPNLPVKEVANNELLEEAGFQVERDWHWITTIFPSPGASSERIHLYWAEVDAASKVGEGGGLVAEGEDIMVEALPFSQALAQVNSGKIMDAKTVIAILHLAHVKSQ